MLQPRTTSTRPRRRTIRRGAALVLGVAVSLAVAGCGSGQDDGEGGTPITLRTDVYFTGAVLPFMVGIDRGIYAEHGLDVEMKPGKGSATTLQTVGNGSDDIGYADAGTVVQSRAKGIDAHMVGGMVQESPLAIFTKKDSGITRPAQLAGKTGGYTAGSAAETLFPAYAKATQLAEDSVRFRKVDVPTRNNLFLQGETQFTFGLTNVSTPNLRAKCDCELTVMRYGDAGVNALSSGIVVSDQFAADNPDAVRSFLAATAEATSFAVDNPDKAVDSFSEIESTSKLPDELVEKQWRASAPLLHSQRTENEPFGCMAEKDWTDTIGLMERYGEVPSGAVSPDDVYANDHLPETCGKS